jgi:hypothetical protein
MHSGIPRTPCAALALTLCILAWPALGCAHRTHTVRTVERVHSSGPPPWAPAHGHRHRHAGVSLVFDSGIGVYLVSGRTDHFFHQDHFYRHHHGRFERTRNLSGGWVVVRDDHLPGGLRHRYGHRARHLKRARASVHRARHELAMERRAQEQERARARREHERMLEHAKRRHERELAREDRSHRHERHQQRHEQERRRVQREHGHDRGHDGRRGEKLTQHARQELRADVARKVRHAEARARQKERHERDQARHRKHEKKQEKKREARDPEDGRERALARSEARGHRARRPW